jgi:sugar transferase (PEP-CTERM/EpsH1 system associated)
VKLLFLTHRLPYAPNRGDRIRAYHLLKALSGFAEVTLVSLVHDADEAAQVGAMSGLVAQAHAVTVTHWRNRVRALGALPSHTPLTHVLLNAPSLTSTVTEAARTKPSVVFAFCSGMARLAYLPVLAGVPLVHDMVDVDSAKWKALSAAARWPLSSIYERESRTLRQFESDLTRRASQTLVVNAREQQLLLDIAPGSRVTVLENGVDVAAFRPDGPPSEAPAVVFTGVFDYGPNEAAALWLMAEVWPRVRSERPDARLFLVGARPSAAVRQQASSSDATVTGAVPDVRPYLWKSAVAVAPIFLSHGLQNKVLEALAARLPVVTTTAVADGLPSQAVAACSIADTPDAFAREILGLLAMTPGERRAKASRLAIDTLDWSRTLGSLEGIVRDVAGL